MFHYYGMRKVEKRKIYDLKYIFLLSVILLMLLLIIILSNCNFILRYSILLVACVFMIIKYKNKILNILTELI